MNTPCYLDRNVWWISGAISSNQILKFLEQIQDGLWDVQGRWKKYFLQSSTCIKLWDTSNQGVSPISFGYLLLCDDMKEVQCASNWKGSDRQIFPWNQCNRQAFPPDQHIIMRPEYLTMVPFIQKNTSVGISDNWNPTITTLGFCLDSSSGLSQSQPCRGNDIKA